MGGDKEGNWLLPPGYTRLEFLRNSGAQYIVLPVEFKQGSGMAVRYTANNYDSFSYLSIIRYGASSVQFGRISNDKITGISTTAPNSSTFVRNDGVIAAAYNAYSSGKINVTSPSEEAKNELVAAPEEGHVSGPVYLFAYDVSSKLGVYNPTPAAYSLYDCVFTQGTQATCRLVPAINPSGRPCLFDEKSSTAYINSGTGDFIAGVATVAQLNTLLSRLASSTTRSASALKLSLPAEANTPEVSAAMEQCQSQTGMTLTVHEYRPAAATTYSLRRVRQVVWCRKQATEYGCHVDSTGTRWQIERCAAIFGPHGNDPAAYGYHPFDNEDQAAEAWSLTPYQYPEQELNPNQ